MSNKKLTLKIVKERLSKKSPTIKITSNEYKNAHTRMNCFCEVCKHEWENHWGSLHRGHGCPNCNPSKKLTIEGVRKYVSENSECELLSETYSNSRAKMTFQCPCGSDFKKTFTDFKRNIKNCPTCSYNRTGKSKRVKREDVERLVSSKGYFLDMLEWADGVARVHFKDDNGYKHCLSYQDLKTDAKRSAFGIKNAYHQHNIKKMIDSVTPGYKVVGMEEEGRVPLAIVKCDEGHIYKTNAHNHIRGRRCYKCYRSNNMGKNHPRYNPLLTEEERTKSRYELYGNSQSVWSRNVHKKHHYKCMICKSRESIEAHHLESWDIAKHMRYSVGNGVTLCKAHHADFHKIYGYGSNTRIQFEHYLESEHMLVMI